MSDKRYVLTGLLVSLPILLASLAFSSSSGTDFDPDAPVITPTWQANSKLLAATIVINEVYPGSPDYIELYNAGDDLVDLSYWKMVSTGGAVDTHYFPYFILQPGSHVKVLENAGTNTNDTIYTGTNMNWVASGVGSVSLSDTEQAWDFVRWGGSTEPIPAGTSWDESSGLLTMPSDPNVIARGPSGYDRDRSDDWCIQGQSAPGENIGCPIFSDGFESGNTTYWSSAVY
jgi:hypothetical protein